MLLSEDPLSEGLQTWKGREEKGTGGLTYKMSSFVIVLRLWFRTGAEEKGSGFIIHSHGKIKVRNYIILLMTLTPNTELERVVHKLSGNKIMFWSLRALAWCWSSMQINGPRKGSGWGSHWNTNTTHTQHAQLALEPKPPSHKHHLHGQSFPPLSFSIPSFHLLPKFPPFQVSNAHTTELWNLLNGIIV